MRSLKSPPGSWKEAVGAVAVEKRHRRAQVGERHGALEDRQGVLLCFPQFTELANRYVLDLINTHPVSLVAEIGRRADETTPWYGEGARPPTHEVVERLRLRAMAARLVILRWDQLRTEWVTADADRRIELWRSVELAINGLGVVFPIDGYPETTTSLRNYDLAFSCLTEPTPSVI